MIQRAAFEWVGDWIALMGGDSGLLYRATSVGITGEGRDFGLLVAGEPRWLGS